MDWIDYLDTVSDLIVRCWTVRAQVNPLAGRAIERILADGGPPPKVTALASLLGCSRRHLSMSFRRAFGRTPSRLIRDQRLALACARLVLRPSASVEGVALAVGFAGDSSLARATRRDLGVRPTDVRQEAPRVLAWLERRGSWLGLWWDGAPRLGDVSGAISSDSWPTPPGVRPVGLPGVRIVPNGPSNPRDLPAGGGRQPRSG